MPPAPLQLFALRHGLIPLEAVLAPLRGFDPAAYSGVWQLAPALDDRELAELHRTLRASRGPTGAVVAAWIDRGRLATAREEPSELAPYLLEKALGVASGAERSAWVQLAADRLRAALADGERTTRDRLAIAKLAIGALDPAEQRAALAALREGYEADLASGAYEELDLAYGDVDPTLELARACAAAGDHAASAALLDAREGRHAAFFNHEEVLEAIAMAAAAPPDRLAAVAERFGRWARATDAGGESAGIAEVHWLVGLPAGAPVDVDAELSRLVASATMATACGTLLGAERAPGGARVAAAEKLVALASGYVDALVEVTRTGAVTDWARHATSVRQLRDAAFGLANGRELVPSAGLEALREVGARWALWLVGQDISFDALPYVSTAISFARLVPDATRAASAHAAALRAKGHALVDHDGWEHLYAPEDALAVARDALANA
jgi:hypothetical protein